MKFNEKKEERLGQFLAALPSRMLSIYCNSKLK